MLKCRSNIYFYFNGSRSSPVFVTRFFFFLEEQIFVLSVTLHMLIRSTICSVDFRTLELILTIALGADLILSSYGF